MYFKFQGSNKNQYFFGKKDRKGTKGSSLKNKFKTVISELYSILIFCLDRFIDPKTSVFGLIKQNIRSKNICRTNLRKFSQQWNFFENPKKRKKPLRCHPMSERKKTEILVLLFC